MKNSNNIIKLPEVFKKYIENNIKEYLLITIIFIIGLFAGVVFINNCRQENQEQISSYIEEFIEKFKDMESIEKGSLSIGAIKSNIGLVIILWLAGTTVIGVPIVLGIILFRGFCLGFTISSVTYTIGTTKGIAFCLSALFLKNMLFIPAIITLGVSSIKLYKSIMKDRRKDNIKLEIVRHTIISGLMLFIIIIGVILDAQISIFILHKVIKYF